LKRNQTRKRKSPAAVEIRDPALAELVDVARSIDALHDRLDRLTHPQLRIAEPLRAELQGIAEALWERYVEISHVVNAVVILGKPLRDRGARAAPDHADQR
jgi:hypothetical protein